jgi:hypothetical protein
MVTSGETDSMVYQESGQPATNDIFNKVNMIEGLFKIIREALDRKVDKLTVEYRVDLGYPKSIIIDPDEKAYDDEISYVVSEFALLK